MRGPLAALTAAALTAVGAGCGDDRAAPPSAVAASPAASAASAPSASASAAGSGAATAAGRRWRRVHAHDYGDFDSMRTGVMFGPADGWAFGETNVADEAEPSLPVALRWNGRRWHRARLPARLDGGFTAAGASAPDEIWAVGSSETGSYALRFDGRRWKVVRGVPPNVHNPLVFGRRRVRMFDADGSWSLDGAAWRRARLPAQMLEVSAVSARDIWGIGVRQSADGTAEQIVVHFDGRRWTEESLGGALPPDDGVWLTEFLSLHAIAKDDVWVFGERRGIGQGTTIPANSERADLVLPLAAHWDGRAWSRVPVPGGRRFGDAVSDARGRVHVIATKLEPPENFGRGTTASDVVLTYSPARGAPASSKPPASPGGVSWTVSPLAAAPGETVRLYGLASVPGTGEVFGFGAVETTDENVTTGSAIFTSGRP